MISCLLSCAHQTHDMINAYYVFIISYLYPALYHILPLSYLDHQTEGHKLVFPKKLITNFCPIIMKFLNNS